MSLSTRNYSKESRSSSYYSRSSSYHASANTNNSFNSSFVSRALTDDRPLSTRLIERDSSWPSLTWNWLSDDPFYFDRLRWRFDSDFFKLRPLPIYYRSWNNSTGRIIPIQYNPSAKNRRSYLYRKVNDDSDSSLSKRHDESSILRENRLASDDWPVKQGPPTRKRTSMTIFIQKPFIDQSEVPYYRQTPTTPTYPQSARIDYY